MLFGDLLTNKAKHGMAILATDPGGIFLAEAWLNARKLCDRIFQTCYKTNTQTITRSAP